MITSDSDFLKFAFSKYDNPHLSFISEFEADIKRFTYLNNLLNRYREDSLDLKDRLILNHIVILGNIFTVAGSLEMYSFKISHENKPILETFLFYLGFISSTETKIDFYLLDILNEN